MRTLGLVVGLGIHVAAAAQEVLRESVSTPAVDCATVSSIGDWDGDGRGDYLSVAWLCANYPTQPCSWSGLIGVSGLDGSVLFGFPSPTPMSFLSWRGIGDMDGDGRRDVAVRVANTSGLYPMYVAVLSTQTGLPLWYVSGPYTSGLGTHFVGDLDTDGGQLTDLVTVGSWHVPEARVDVYDHHGQLRYSIVFGSGGFASIHGLGKVDDVDGDGCDEFVVGFWKNDSLGYVRLVSGRTGSTLQQVSGVYPNDYLSLAPTGVGDMDGDGIPDFCAGNQGALLMVFSGATGDVIHEFRDSNDRTAGGASQIGGHDVDLDGVPDLVTSAPGSINGPGWNGRINAYSGRDGRLLWTQLSDPNQGPHTGYGSQLADLGIWPESPFPVLAQYEPEYGFPLGGRIQVLRTNLPGAGTQTGSPCSSRPRVPTIGFRTSPAGLRLSIARAPSGGFGILTLGSSTTSHLGTPLPHALDPYGLRGCSLLVSPEVLTTRVLGNTGRDAGYAHVDFPGVPVAAGGQRWFAQWFVLAPHGAVLDYAATAAQEFMLQ